MSSSKRTLRSAPKPELAQPATPISRSPVSFEAIAATDTLSEAVQINPIGSTLAGLDAAASTLLRQRQQKLAATAASSSTGLSPHQLNAICSTLIFSQHEAGTSVCIHKSGWLLTCSHCVGESPAEWQANKRKWLLYYDGTPIQAECRAWDPVRDLALLKVIRVETGKPEADKVPVFKCVSVASSPPKARTSIFCLGQPGAEDLESETYRKTKYNLIELSEGKFCGMVQDANPNDNSQIGSLKHDAWTYWGHSGAPLVDAGSGELIGLHSSWDSKTGMRHGIPLVAVREFLDLHLVVMKEGELRKGESDVDASISKKNVELNLTIESG